MVNIYTIENIIYIMTPPYKEWLFGSSYNVWSDANNNNVYAQHGDVMRIYDASTYSVIKDFYHIGATQSFAGGGGGIRSNANVIAIGLGIRGTAVIKQGTYDTIVIPIPAEGVKTDWRATWDSSIDIAGNLLYIAYGFRSNRIDIYDTTSFPPTFIRTVTTLAGGASKVIAYPDFFIGVEGGDTLQIYDPNGVYISSYLYGGPLADVNRYGNYLYITGDRVLSGGVLIKLPYIDVVDISSLAAPTRMNQVQLTVNTKTKTATIVNNYLITGHHDLDVKIWSLLDPVNITQVGTYDYRNEIGGYVTGSSPLGASKFVVSSDYGGVAIVDISNPSTPVSLFKSPKYGDSFAAIATDDIVHVMEDYGYRIVDTKNSIGQSIIADSAFYGRSGRSPRNMDKSADSKYIYGAFTWNGVRFYKLAADKKSATIAFEATQTQYPGYGVAVKRVGNYIYYKHNSLTIFEYDPVADTHTEVVNSVPMLSGEVMNVYGNYLYLTPSIPSSVNNNLHIYDVSNQLNPVFIKSLPLYPWFNAVGDGYLFVSVGTGATIRMEIYDIATDPINPVLLATVKPSYINYGTYGLDYDPMHKKVYVGFGTHVACYDMSAGAIGIVPALVWDLDFIGTVNCIKVDPVKSTLTVASNDGVKFFDLAAGDCPVPVCNFSIA